MSVLVIGSVAIDTIETPFGKSENILGGSATYFSLACSLFNRVNLVAVVGNDISEYNLNFLRKKNIDLTGLNYKDGKTFKWHGKYFNNLNKRQTLNLDLGVFGDFNPQIPDSYTNSKYIFLANIDPKLQYKILSYTKSCKIIAADTMDHWIKKQEKDLSFLLDKVDIFILNDQEAKLISKTENIIKAGSFIQKKGPSIVIIKRGEHGLLLFEKEKIFTAPAYPLKNIIDPTGAGDAFAGGFIGYLSYKDKITSENLRVACIYGQVIASFCVESFGVANLAKLTKQKIKERFLEFKKITKF